MSGRCLHFMGLLPKIMMLWHPKGLCLFLDYRILSDGSSVSRNRAFPKNPLSADMCFIYESLYEPVLEISNNLGFRPGPRQTGLYSHRR